ncbi:MAG: phosphatidate cytidylyltransferase [Solirubrobacterales bacterium]
MARRDRRSAPDPVAEAASPETGKGKKGGSSEMLRRVLWSIPLIIIAIVVVGAGGLVFVAAMAVLGVLALMEYFKIAERARPFTYAGFAAVIGLVIAAHYGTQFQIVIVLAAAFALVFGFALVREQRDNVSNSMAITMLGILWIGVPLAHAVLLRDLPLHGGALMIDVLLATFLADTCAYVGGRMFGRTPLAPSISPGKTVEGLVAGFIGGTATLWIAGLYQDWLSGVDALILGACVAAVAPLGDLFESMLKRDFSVKDTGRLFGPHGGVLDRVDAALFTVVVGYYVSVALVF